jgi:arginine/lysine/ornithine decarboxylase
MKLDQSRTPLYDAIMGYIDADVTLFHIPSHKMGRGIHPVWLDFAGGEIFKMDLSEVRGLDDLHAPEGAILEAQKLAADAWGARESFFLVNGTSGGLIASVAAVASEGDEIIIPRNVHKSVINGLIVSGASPVYVRADVDPALGLTGGLSPCAVSETFAKHPGAKGLVCVSPTYHGVCSDVGALAEVTHAHGGVLIADEAHGNHFYFHPELPAGALALGADLSCQSTHKMSGSLTQSSILHLNSDRVDRARLAANLRLIQSTSPSYLLMVSLDMARSYIATRGQGIVEELIRMSLSARERIRALPGMSVLGDEIVRAGNRTGSANEAVADMDAGTNHITALDPIRIVLSAREMGFDGYELSRFLRDDYNIEIEFADFFYCVCTMGLGTRPEDVARLLFALSEISAKYYGLRAPLTWEEALPPLPPVVLTPRSAFFCSRKEIPWSDAKGEVCADMIVPYPPGIPAICPGERITDEVWDYLDEMRRKKRHIHGFDGTGVAICNK